MNFLYALLITDPEISGLYPVSFTVKGKFLSALMDVFNFQEYVVEQRIAKAKILLLTTDMKIYEIAENVGFYDVNYFSARFKHHVGMTLG